jgi:hypothetical protein
MKIILKFIKISWALPATMIGLLLSGICRISGGKLQVIDGVIEAQGGVLTVLLSQLIPRQGGCSAITLGHVILGRDQHCLDACRRHEHVHVAQYERWGPLMIPAYLLASFFLLIQGKDAYLDNPFEMNAREKDSG